MPGNPTSCFHPKGEPRSVAKSTRLRVALLNDFDVVVNGLAAMLAPFSDEITVVDLSLSLPTRRTPLDIALFDTFGRAGLDEPRLARVVGQENVHHTVVYTFDFHRDLVDTALHLGVHGYLWKGLAGAELVLCLKRIGDGETVVSEARSPNDPLRVPEVDWPGRDWGLTARESEALVLLGQGLRNREIASAMYVGVDTVKTHLRNAYRKLGVTHRAAAIARMHDEARFSRNERLV
jgi:DNA-binding NarL/FixJ family response regulator